MANRIVLNETSYHGKGAVQDIVTEVKKRCFKKALVVTDPDLIKFHVADNVTKLLDANGLFPLPGVPNTMLARKTFTTLI